jgi:hypothetical protein
MSRATESLTDVAPASWRRTGDRRNLLDEQIDRSGATDHPLLKKAEVLFSGRQSTFETQPFPLIARVILNMRCQFTCGVRDACHREGMPPDVAAMDLDTAKLAQLRLLRLRFALTSAKLIGLETTRVETFCSFIEPLKAIGFDEVTTTCAIDVARRSVQQLIAAGISRVTCSVHDFTPAVEETLDSVVNTTRRRSIELKLNWVLRRSTTAALPKFISYIQREALTARLFRQIMTLADSAPEEPAAPHWTDYGDMFADDVTSVRVIDYLVSCRRRYVVSLRSGAYLDLSIPLVATLDRADVPHICGDCAYRVRCEEGLLGCGVRMGPDGRYYSCLMRPDALLTF